MDRTTKVWKAKEQTRAEKAKKFTYPSSANCSEDKVH